MGRAKERTMMTTATRIPLPAGAIDAGEWQVSGDEEITRMFHGTKRGDRVSVDIDGTQHYAGEVTRHAWVGAGQFGVELDAEGLPELAADALATADELDTLSS
jgi:hypothetical protein